MSLEALELIDFILVFFIVILITLLIKTIFPQKHLQFINWFSILSTSVIFVFVSGVLTYFLGYAADEIPHFTDVRFSIYKFIAIVGLAFVNSIVAMWKRNATNG